METLQSRELLAADLGFIPLAESVEVGSLDESTPFDVPNGYTQQAVQTRFADEDLLHWPAMNVVNETAVRDHTDLGRYIFATHKASTRAEGAGFDHIGYTGVTRTDTWTGETKIIAQRSDLERFDGLVWTPWGTLLAAEEVVLSSYPDPDVQANPEFFAGNPSPRGEGPYEMKYSGLVYEIDPFPEDFATDYAQNAIVVGHRGASGDRPEHTLEAYQLAIDLGADFIGIDLVPTKDSILIARHENELSGTTDVADRAEFADRETTKTIDGAEVTGWFSEDFALEEIKTLRAKERIPGTRPQNTDFNGQFQIPTLAEVIDLVKRVEAKTGKKVGIYLETKHPTFFMKEGQLVDGSPINQDLIQMLVDTLVANEFTDPDRIFIQSFEFESLIRLQREILPAVGHDIPIVQRFGDTDSQFVTATGGGFSVPYDFVYNATHLSSPNTTAPSYAYDLTGGYDITPLLTVGDEMPLLTSTVGGEVTVSGHEKYAMAGVPDGLGVFETEQYNFVFMNHELNNSAKSKFTVDGNEVIKGARVSLLVFDKNWNVLGGKNLIERVVDDGVTYTLNTESGNYEDDDGNVFNVNFYAGGGFARFCSGYLAAHGFVDGNGEPSPVWFAPEEVDDLFDGEAGTGRLAESGRGWAVFTDGTAYAIDGLGKYSKEQVYPASQYRPAEGSGTTVIFSPEDFWDGEVYMFVGRQDGASSNVLARNGMADGDLYVLRVKDAEGNVFADEAFIADGPQLYIAEWVRVPQEIQLGTSAALRAWSNGVDAEGNPRSTNFARPEDLHEDPSNPGTFYFANTGVSGTRNVFGTLHRFTLNADDVTDEGTFYFLLEGGPDTGVSYDNITITSDGHVLIQENRAAGGHGILADQERMARVLSYDIATGNVEFLFELNQAFVEPHRATDYGRWESSGIVETSDGSFLFDVQAKFGDKNFVTGGQLLLATKSEDGQAELHEAYGDLMDVVNITPTTGYDGVISQAAINWMAENYAEGLGPWKNTIVRRTGMDQRLDQNGDGVPHVGSRLTGEIHELFHFALDAGLDVHPYTLRAEENFLTSIPGNNVELIGFASLPADTSAPKPQSGADRGNPPGTPIDAKARTDRFASQRVQGFSGVQFAPEGGGSYWFLSGNGYGAQTNSSDYLLRLYQADPNFTGAEGGDGTVALQGFVQLHDRDNRIPFDITNEDSVERKLTGADFDIESFVIADNGDIWIGEEHGPFILHFDSTGSLLEAPIPTPDLNVDGTLSATEVVRAPQNPDFAGVENPLSNLPRSRGYEGIAFSPDRGTLYPMLEGSVDGDPSNSLRIYSFDVASSSFTGLVGFYRKDADNHAIGGFTPINDAEFLVIEGDGRQTDNNGFKRVFKIDISQKDENGFFAKELLVDLMNVPDPNGLASDGGAFDFPAGNTYRMPSVAIEDVLVIDPQTILIANNHNYPILTERPSDEPDNKIIDNNEIVMIALDTPLNLDERLGGEQFVDKRILSARPQSPTEEVSQLIELGVSGFFIDNSDVGYQGRNAHFNVTPRTALGSFSHGGIAFDESGNVYVIDEFSEGAIYRFTPDNAGDPSSGVLAALKVADAEVKTGAAEWVTLDGDALTVNTRILARDAEATTYSRPGDVEYFENVVYVAITGEDRVLAIDISDPVTPVVHDYATPATTNAATGAAAGHEYDAPDNLAIDPDGRVFIVEDRSPGDIWAGFDANGDFVADLIGRFLSLSTAGSEPTGAYFDPDRPRSDVCKCPTPR